MKAVVLLAVLWLALPAQLLAHSDLLSQIEQLDNQITEQGATVDRLLSRGDLYRRHQDYSAAARDFEQARKLDPTNAQLGFFIGRLQLETGEPEAARSSLSDYLSQNPAPARAWNLLAEADIQVGDLESAAEHYAKAIETSTSPSPEIYRARVLSLLAVGKSAWDEADKVLQRGLEQFGTEVNLLGLAVDLALAEARTEKARELLSLLPAGLDRLPQWSSRIDLAACDSDECLQRAEENLASQVNVFLSSL